MARPILLAYFLVLCGSYVRAGESQHAADSQAVVVCPPKYGVPLFVPSEELRGDSVSSSEINPDWIVRQRPLPDCIHCLGDSKAREFENVGYPLKLREYDSQIRMLRAEIAATRRKLDEYRYFNKSGALLITVENTNLSLLASEEALRNLRYERMLYLRHQNLEKALRQ